MRLVSLYFPITCNPSQAITLLNHGKLEGEDISDTSTLYIQAHPGTRGTNRGVAAPGGRIRLQYHDHAG